MVLLPLLPTNARVFAGFNVMPVGLEPTVMLVNSDSPVDESNTVTFPPVRFATYTRLPAALTAMPYGPLPPDIAVLITAFVAVSITATVPGATLFAT